ncbi:MAG TPA: high-affinity nickel-transport family protein, partial [Candidatus Methylomirabilis sp.]|nr:high-affinity nickel-transport family protein [Candidatus Methylomirabilis sp.]
MELCVAAMLILLGAFRIAWVFRGGDAVPLSHLGESHEASVPDFHSHPHAHGGHVHHHPHVHAPRRLASALRAVGFAQAVRSVCVGLVHGMAGSAAVALLVLSTIRSPYAALAYLLVFGAGTILGMTATTALLCVPFTTVAPWLVRWRRWFSVATGALSLSFGIYLAIQIGFGDGLFLGHPIWQPR